MTFKKDVGDYTKANANLLKKQQEYNNTKNRFHGHAKERILEEITKCAWIAKRSEKDTIKYYLWTDNPDFMEFIEEYKDLGAFKDPFRMKYSFGEILIRDNGIAIIPSESGLDELDQYVINCDSDDIRLGVDIVNEKIDILQNKIDALNDNMSKRPPKKKGDTMKGESNG